MNIYSEVWQLADISLPTVFSRTVVVPPVVFLSEIETVRYCRSASISYLSVLPLDYASYSVTLKQTLLLLFYMLTYP